KGSAAVAGRTPVVAKSKRLSQESGDGNGFMDGSGNLNPICRKFASSRAAIVGYGEIPAGKRELAPPVGGALSACGQAPAGKRELAPPVEGTAVRSACGQAPAGK